MSHPVVDAELVRRVASLAKLDLNDDQVVQAVGELNRMLDFVDLLSEADVDLLPPLVHPHDVLDAVRDDLPEAGLSRSDALANAARHDDTCFRVPPVLG